MEQEAIGNPQYQVALTNPDYAEYAKLCGGDGVTVVHSADLEKALRIAYASDIPYIVNVEINPEELTLPPHISMKTAGSYVIAKLKEILGKGDK